MQALKTAGAAPGSVDAALENLLPLMEADLFGNAAEAKENSTFAAKHKEAKAVKAYDTFELLATLTTFDTHIETLLLPVRDRLHLAGQPAVRAKLVQLLHAAARGVLASGAAPDSAVLRYVYSALSEASGSFRPDAAEPAEASGTLEPASDAAALHGGLITEFAVSLLAQRLRKGGLDLTDRPTLERLDPLLDPLVGALSHRSGGVVAQALKCLAALAPAALPTLPAAAAAAGARALEMLQQSPNTGTSTAQVRFSPLSAYALAGVALSTPVSFLLMFSAAGAAGGGSRRGRARLRCCSRAPTLAPAPPRFASFPCRPVPQDCATAGP